MRLIRARTMPDEVADDLVDPERDKRGNAAAQGGDLPPSFGPGSGEKPQKDDSRAVDKDAERLERIRRVCDPLVVDRELVYGMEDPVVHRRRMVAVRRSSYGAPSRPRKLQRAFAISLAHGRIGIWALRGHSDPVVRRRGAPPPRSRGGRSRSSVAGPERRCDAARSATH